MNRIQNIMTHEIGVFKEGYVHSNTLNPIETYYDLQFCMTLMMIIFPGGIISVFIFLEWA